MRITKKLYKEYLSLREQGQRSEQALNIIKGKKKRELWKKLRLIKWVDFRGRERAEWEEGPFRIQAEKTFDETGRDGPGENDSYGTIVEGKPRTSGAIKRGRGRGEEDSHQEYFVPSSSLLEWMECLGRAGEARGPAAMRAEEIIREEMKRFLDYGSTWWHCQMRVTVELEGREIACEWSSYESETPGTEVGGILMNLVNAALAETKDWLSHAAQTARTLKAEALC